MTAYGAKRSRTAFAIATHAKCQPACRIINARVFRVLDVKKEMIIKDQRRSGAGGI